MKTFNKILKSALAFTIGTLVLIAFLEMGIRVFFQFRHQPPTTYDVTTETPDPDHLLIRIVTLGESTTESVFENGVDVSWPQQLETKLNNHLVRNKNPYRVKIVNLARSGTFSAFQVMSLQSVFSKNPPDIIVSMLGINDSNRLPIEQDRLYELSYLVRFVYWSMIAYQCPNCYLRELGRSNAPVENQTQMHLATRQVSQRLVSQFRAQLGVQTSEAANRSAFEDYKSKLAKAQNTHREAEHILNAESAVQLFSVVEMAGFQSSNPTLSREILKFALGLMITHYEKTVLKEISYVQHICHIRYRLNGANCLEDLRKAIQNGVPVTYSLLKMSAVQEGVQEDPFFQTLFQSVGFEIDHTSTDAAATQNSYRAIGDFSNKHKTMWFAMQYPTGSIEGIKQYLSDEAPLTSKNFAEGFHQFKTTTPLLSRYKNVIFVGNENFNSLVSSENTREYFLDLFGMNQGLHFGHTTAKGHTVIAENIFQEIIKKWKTIEERKSGN